MNNEEILDYIRKKVAYLEETLKDTRHPTSYYLMDGKRLAYLDIYDKFTSSLITDEDKEWAEEILNDGNIVSGPKTIMTHAERQAFMKSSNILPQELRDKL